MTHMVNTVTAVESHEDFLKHIRDAEDKLVIVDFYADWCGPCKRIAPFIEELAQINEDVIFLKVNVDQNEETATVVGVTSLPTFYAYKDNEKLQEVVGADPEKIVALLAQKDVWELND